MKNMDPLNDNVVQLFQDSSNWLVAILWKDTGLTFTVSVMGLHYLLYYLCGIEKSLDSIVTNFVS